MKFYAGIGSRNTPPNVLQIMKEVALILEDNGYILRSGGAQGADEAFQSGVKYPLNMEIYLPYPGFRGKYMNQTGYLYIDNHHQDYDKAYQSLIYHPAGFKMRQTVKNFMIRNYFQIYGIMNRGLSRFVICWTPGAANGYTIKTTFDDGGTAQAIRLAAVNNIPVYNLNDSRYSTLSAHELVSIILKHSALDINPDVVDSYAVSELF